MKKGFRTPNLSKRVSSRTTGKLTRSTRSLTNPLYGKKSTGFANDPERALYNKIYNKTTFGTDEDGCVFGCGCLAVVFSIFILWILVNSFFSVK